MTLDTAHDVDSQWVVAQLKKYINDQTPKEVSNVDVTLASAVGENFLSTVYRVKVTTILSSGLRKDFSVIVKNEIPGIVQKVMGSLLLFPTEIKAFTIVVPMMNSLMDEFNDTRDRITCDCLGYRANNTVIMEDLIANGYTTIDRTKWQTVEQAQLVLRTMARMHAMSKVLFARGLLDSADKGHNLFVSESPAMRRMFPAFAQVLARAIRTKWDKKWRQISDKVRNLRDICEKMISISKCEEKFEVYNHGDLWSSNIMWKFTEYGNVPVSVKFIDWQFAHINSFIIDVIYVLHTSVRPSLRRQNLDLLIETYHEALEKNLKFFQYEGYVPSIEDVRSEYDRTAILRLVFVAFCMPITSTGISGLSFDVGSLFDREPEELINEGIFTEEKYITEAGPDLKHFCDVGII